MKTLKDGTTVAARTYYYLLDYMDRHFDEKPLYQLFSKERLCDTNIDEYIRFFQKATSEDIRDLIKDQGKL
jgi:hypothetical protein